MVEILVYGAGVIGSVYAARLQAAGQNVTLLARGDRLKEVQEHGVVLENALTGIRTQTRLRVVEELASDATFDLAIVAVGKHQLKSVLPSLERNEMITNILFLHNNAAGPQEMVDAVGRERALFGFPGAGGKRDGPVVRYMLIKQQRTTIGELDGRRTRLLQAKEAFESAGFPTDISEHVDAALKTHAVFITCMESAILSAGGNSKSLAENKELLGLMVDSTKEGFEGLRKLKVPIVPFRMKAMFAWTPKRFVIRYWKGALNGELGTLSLAPHAMAATGELRQLEGEIKSLLISASVATPTMDKLYESAGLA